ncbi:FtsW/RodA/SpoVE family cell cycle protein [Dactylosporangium sp. CA-139114]|uniref:FtsW/RodA/SpoVE family cell cycle protein n=1 Tax=Dactylosporangium sp. CA-139114 TaxID=3239931 RepID=UPI003D995F5F
MMELTLHLAPVVGPVVAVWAGLVWAVVVAARLLLGRRAAPVGAVMALVVPFGLIAGGFAAGGTHPWWVVLVSCGVLGLCELARRRFVLGAAPAGERRAVAAALAVVVSAGALLEFGAMLAVRLVVRPDPADTFFEGLRSRPFFDGVRALGVPLLGVLVLLLAAQWARRLGAAWLWRGSADGRRTWPWEHGWRRPLVLGWAVAAVLLVLFLLPAAAGGDRLTVLTVATPEYAKLLFLLTLSVVVAFDSHRYGIPERGLLRRLLWRRWVWLPIGLFGIVVLGSIVRNDFGVIVSALAATAGLTWSAGRFAMERRPDATQGKAWRQTRRRVGRTAWTVRPFAVIGLFLVLFAGGAAWRGTDYVSERARVWADPWQYRWDSGCVTVDPTPSGPQAPGRIQVQAQAATAGSPEAMSPSPAAQRPMPRPQASEAPPGWLRCQQAQNADAESRRSQLARALSAVTDGGLWGRGLQDVSSSVVPAGSTDFVLVIIWHKLGAVAVLAAAALTALLAAALPRAARLPGDGREEQAGRGPTAAELFAAGLSAMIIGQFLFVLAATVNVIPHSGVPAPLLSRGGQSNLALLVAIALVLGFGAAARTDATAAREPDAPAPDRRRLFGVVAPVAFAALIILLTTLLPYWAWSPAGGGGPGTYAEGRPACPPRSPERDAQLTPPPDPRTCSTDGLAYRRTVVEIRLGGRRALRQWRPDGIWRVVHDPALGGLTDQDLAGLLRIDGSPAGTLDRAYPTTLSGSAGIRLVDRLVPHGPDDERDPADGGLALTLDAGLQHEVAAALRAGSSPLPAGAVVIDAATGRVLAGVSVPAAPRPAGRDADEDRATIVGYQQAYPDYAPIAADGSLDGSRPDPRCRRHEPSDECWRWSIRPQARAVTEAGATELRHYVGDDPAVALPDPAVDRALGRGYELGPLLRLVVAAAYLNQPGHAATDPLPAPAPRTESGSTAAAGPSSPAGCVPDADGRVPLDRALAAGCDGTFAALAATLGWSQIAAQAERFGFTLTGNCGAAGAWLTWPLPGSAGTCLPRDSRGDDVARRTDAVATPLGVATMIAAIANHGGRVQPALVTAAASPVTGVTLDAPPAQAGTALPAGAADQLAAALRGPGPGDEWHTTATYVQPAPHPDQYADRYVWLAGSVTTARYGRVAFAVVVECRSESAGTDQASHVLDTIRRIGG